MGSATQALFSRMSDEVRLFLLILIRSELTGYALDVGHCSIAEPSVRSSLWVSSCMVWS
jgi:hypothetical protein